MKGWASDWHSLLELDRSDATLYRLLGIADTAGHHEAVFEADEAVSVIVRPWESDMSAVAGEAQTGHTPGVKIYANPDDELTRDDRVHHNGQAFRLENPQTDSLMEIERWDGKDDERDLIMSDEIADGVEIHPPEEREY